MAEHRHDWDRFLVWPRRIHDNANRTRTRDLCQCGAIRYGCKAKRLDDDGEPSWGLVGVQYYRVKEPNAGTGRPAGALPSPSELHRPRDHARRPVAAD